MASKKLHRLADSSDEELSVDMSPMIDMVFLLLMFFLVAATVIVVKQDPKVEPPVAKNSKKPKGGKGRIVINVREDGTYLSEKANVTFGNTEDLIKYIKEQKILMESRGQMPILHLRGDKRAAFRHSRTVIRAAAIAGVDNVIFSVFGFDKK